MNPLPEFNQLTGYLPAGIHQTDHAGLKQRCVESLKSPVTQRAGPFFDPPRRELLFSGYERLVEALQFAGVEATQWIGGSFISSKPWAKDIDVAHFCNIISFESLAPEIRAMVSQYFKGDQTANICHCDSYFVPVPPDNHPQKSDFDIIRSYWEKKFGHDYAGTPKGIASRDVVIETIEFPPEELSDATTS